MKSFLLFFISICFSAALYAQQVTDLPTGTYETRNGSNKAWDKGNIHLVNESEYTLTASGETGEYKFSVAAQRIFFTSGPLKSFFTRVVLSNGSTVIVLPLAENSDLGLKSEVRARKQ